MYSNPSLLFKKYGNIAKKTNKQTNICEHYFGFLVFALRQACTRQT